MTTPAAIQQVGGASGDADREESRPRARPDPLLGKVLDGRYRLASLLAKGGMGRVYRAEQAPLGRMVAVKVLDVGHEHDDDQEFRRRFVREAETCARLTHPNTVRVFEYGQTDDDVLYIAMELLVGRNLFQAIQTDAPMDAVRVARIGQQIAASLREAHGLGLIHRDLKPSNVILTRPDDDEFVKVVDFGLVKEIRGDAEMTRGDALVGSPGYMSPEQVRSDPLDQRSDVYSLGVLLYTCLCGRPPFHAPTSLAVLMGHLNEAPPPLRSVCPSMPSAPALEAVVLKCLAKAPADRYPDMGALLKALQRAEAELTGVPAPVTGPIRPVASAEAVGPATVPVTSSRPVEAPRRAPGGAVLGGLVALLLAGAGVASWVTRGAADVRALEATDVAPEHATEGGVDGARPADGARAGDLEELLPRPNAPAVVPTAGEIATAVPPVAKAPAEEGSERPVEPGPTGTAPIHEESPPHVPASDVAPRPAAAPRRSGAAAPAAGAPAPPSPLVEEGPADIRDPWAEP